MPFCSLVIWLFSVVGLRDFWHISVSPLNSSSVNLLSWLCRYSNRPSRASMSARDTQSNRRERLNIFITFGGSELWASSQDVSVLLRRHRNMSLIHCHIWTSFYIQGLFFTLHWEKIKHWIAVWCTNRLLRKSATPSSSGKQTSVCFRQVEQPEA